MSFGVELVVSCASFAQKGASLESWQKSTAFVPSVAIALTWMHSISTTPRTHAMMSCFLMFFLPQRSGLCLSRASGDRQQAVFGDLSLS